MSDFIPVSTLDRRSVIRGLALGLTSLGMMDFAAVQEVHSETNAERAAGPYKIKAFQPGEYKTIQRLTEIIVPKDEVSVSALTAGAPEFIDTLSSQNQKLADIFHGGLAWLDAEMRKRYRVVFVDATSAQQTAMLDLLVEAGRTETVRKNEELIYQKSNTYKEFGVYTVSRSGDLGPGIEFFDWVRKMTVDAFYTSPAGIKDIGYVGNGAYGRYVVPQAALDYAMKRSPFA